MLAPAKSSDRPQAVKQHSDDARFLDRLRLLLTHGVGFTTLRFIAAALCPQFRMRYPVDWMADAEFNSYLRRVGESAPLKSIGAGRHWMIHQLLRLTEAVPGDTAECGVFRGATSYLIARFASRSVPPKTHHLFDSFEGLSIPDVKDGPLWRAGDFAADAGTVMGMLAQFSNVQAHAGWIPQRFDDVANLSFSFVHIDVDLHAPTRDSIEFFYPRLSPGAVLVCDDYGMGTCPGATEAVNTFLAGKPEKMIALTDGGGFFIKGTTTSLG